MRKLKLLLLAACALLGVNVANAYTVDDLTGAGWTRVTSSSITGTGDNYYMLVDCNSSNYVMANQSDHFRPCYKTIDNPVNNPSFVWILEGSGNEFNLKSYSTGAYFKQASGWNTSMGMARDSRTKVTGVFELSDGKYTLKCKESGNYVGHWNDDGAAVASDGENIAANKAIGNAPGFYLYAIARSSFDAALVAVRETATTGASDSEPADVTSWIQNADWSGDWGGWESTFTSSGNMQWGQQTLESWNASNVVVKQELRGVPNGKYRVAADVISGPGATKAAYVFGTGSAKVASSVVSAEASANNYTTMSNEVAGKTLTTDNVVVVDNTITVGVDQSEGWIVADNFKLYYLGEDLSIYVDAYNEAVTAANNVDQNAPMLATVLAALQSAISTYGTGVDTSSKEALLAATSALTTATSNASTSIAAYAVAKTAVDKANAIKEAHNFASTTATSTFAEAIAAISDAYDAGTLSNADANAAGTTLGTVVTGWHANPNAAAVNYMENGFGLNDFDANLYINTWSNEGDNDGSGFSVPFYEYWTGDANSLGANTWTGTLSDLPNGQYKISAWVRVRAKNETAVADATGITMDVNGGGEGEYAAVDVTEGEQVGTSQFQLGTYEALGLVKNGMLYLNFNIADGNNISWLSIKNIKYTKVRDLTPEESFTAPTGISLDKTSVSLQTGEVVTLTATVTPDEADDKTVSWTSNNTNVATVDANGVVTTVNAGTATITATAVYGEDVTATCTVTVADAAAPASWSEVAAGDFYIMNAATGKFLGGANDWGTHASIIEHGIPFTVSISDGKYTLDSHTYNSATAHNFNGTYIDNDATNNLYIVALGNGKYSISTADGSAFVTAWANSTYVTNEAANANSSLAQWYFLSKNDRDKTLAAATTENPVDATYYIKEANISRNLRVSYGKSGWTNISYGEDKNQENSNYNAQVWNASVDVYQEIANIPNGTYTLYMQGFSSGTVKLYANDVEIDVPSQSDGINTQKAAAAAFTNGDYRRSLNVTVTDRTLKIGLKGDCSGSKWLCYDNFELFMTEYTANTGVTASIDKSEIQIGQTATITAATIPATASFNAITYTSSDESVATVDENGVVTAVAVGSATITITANEMENNSTTVDITVTLVVPTAIELSETEVELDKENMSATLTVASTTPDGANDAVIWASSDETVATVADGVVTAVSTGTATITATSVVAPEVSATATVTVSFPESEVPATYYVNNNATRTVYTLGENLFKNGSFGYPNAVYGWKTVGYTTDALASNFTVNATGGVNDGAYITTNGGGVNSEKTIRKSIAVEVGKTYYFSVYTSGKAPSSDNFKYNALFKMSDATTEAGTIKDFEWPQGANNTATEWSQTLVIFTAETPYVGVRMGWNADSKFDEFVLAEVTSTTEGNVDYATAAIPTENIGNKAFQYSQDAIDAVNALVQGEATVEDVENAYEAVTTLNVPDEEQAYNLVFNCEGHSATGNALTLIPNPEQTQGLYGLKYLAPANVNLAQAFYFVHTTGNKYKVFAVDTDGNDRYITTQAEGYGTTWYDGIRTIDDASKAMQIEIRPNGEGLYLLWNTGANKAIAHNGTNNNDFFTNNTANFQFIETTNPSIEINTTAAGWGTVMLPFAVAELPEGVKAYSSNQVKASGNYLELIEVDALEANKPYLIEGEWNEIVTGDAQGTALTYTDGLFTGVYADQKAPADSYVLLKKNEKVGFYKVVADNEPTVKANHAYLTVPAVGARDAFFFGDGETTAISALKALTEGNAEIYNTNGVRIPSLQKGMNIIKTADGAIRKIMVK